MMKIISPTFLAPKRLFTQFVMAALEAAIQPIDATPARRRGWMAGSRPGHDEWRELVQS